MDEQNNEQPREDEEATTPPEGEDTEQPQEEAQGPFSREYVTGLRAEAKQHRLDAREAREEAERLRGELWRARVASTGVLVDPDALPLDPDALDNPDAITAAARDLVARKPWLRAGRTSTDVGQHAAPGGDGFNLAAALRAATT